MPKVALVTLAVALPLYINVYAGIRNVDATLVEAAEDVGLGRLGLDPARRAPGRPPEYGWSGCAGRSARPGWRWFLRSR